jgi:hypothetical protein
METHLGQRIVLLARAAFPFAFAKPAISQVDSPSSIPGSYLRSCPSSSYSHQTGAITATCYKPNNSGTMTTQIYPADCAQGADISNVWGSLRCVAPAGSYGKLGAVPNGSYLLTCHQPTVTRFVHTARVLGALCAYNNPPDWPTGPSSGWSTSTVL